MNNQPEISTITNNLRNYALGDIKETIKLNTQLASFMLCSCFLDQVSAFYWGIQVYEPPKKVGKQPTYKIRERFIKFCEDYLKKVNQLYDSEMLYDDFRCGIVHSYSSEKKLALGRLGDGSHLSILSSGARLEIPLIVTTIFRGKLTTGSALN